MKLVSTIQALKKFLDSGEIDVILKRNNVKDLIDYISILENEGAKLTSKLEKIKSQNFFLEQMASEKNLKNLDFYA